MVRTLVTVAVTLVVRALAAANIFSAALSEVAQPVSYAYGITLLELLRSAALLHSVTPIGPA